ncbi:MAG: tRNA pseudouridine(55) synthase TruB [Gammaproteobacteria bacterium]
MNRNNLLGLLLLDKPIGITSNAALQKVKHLFVNCLGRSIRAGHTGSLDPLASGMLPICLGEATKFSQFLLQADKRYLVTAQLGIKTSTGDAEGEIIQQAPIPILNRDDWLQIFRAFTGEIAQVPSMYSALKHQGQPLYKLARQGIEVARPSRIIHVYSLELINFTAQNCQLRVHCSKGTYIRTLIEDMGDRLGCGAHVSELRRLTVGSHMSEQMITLPELETRSAQQGLLGLTSQLLPLDSMLPDWQEVILSEATAFYLRRGQPVMIPNAPTRGWVRLTLKCNGSLVGVGEILQDGRVAPRRLLHV